MAKNPSKAVELIDHIYNICSVAAVYVWDNVYAYDYILRRVMAKKNPEENEENVPKRVGP